jgi:hypothetical protein
LIGHIKHAAIFLEPYAGFVFGVWLWGLNQDLSVKVNDNGMLLQAMN